MLGKLIGAFRWRRVATLLGRLHRDEQGAEMVEKLLILAAIVLPLLGVIIFFGGDVRDWVAEWWEDIMGRGETLKDTDPI